MLNWINRKMKRKGFTLIELVIVLAILGILIAIAVPRLAGFRDTAAVSADKASAETIVKAAELYSATYNLTEDEKRALNISKLYSPEIDMIDEKTATPQQEGYKEFELKYNGEEFEVNLVKEKSEEEQ